MFELTSKKNEPHHFSREARGVRNVATAPPPRSSNSNSSSNNNATNNYYYNDDDDDDDDDVESNDKIINFPENDLEPLILTSATSPQQQQQQQQQLPTTLLPPQPSTSFLNNNTITIQRKLCLLAPLLFCLYMLTDSNYYYYNQSDASLALDSPSSQQQQHHHHHLAFITALSRHPPSLRVFRIVTEGAFLLACASLALYLWEWAEWTSVTIIEKSAVVALPPPPTTPTTPTATTTAANAANDNGTSLSMGEKINYRHDDHDHEESGKNIVKGEPSSNRQVRITSRAVGNLLFAPPPPPPPASLLPMNHPAHWGRRLLRLVPKRTTNNKKRNRRRRQSIGGGGGGGSGDRSGNWGSSGSISSGERSLEYPKDGSSHSLKRRKNSPISSAAGTTVVPVSIGEKEEVASVVVGGATSPSRISAAAAAAAVAAPMETTTVIQTLDTSDDDNDLLVSTVAQQQQHYHPPPQPPSPASVLGASLDILTITCIFLIFFTISSAEGGRYIDQASDHVLGQQYMKFVANVAAPLFPLTLFGLSFLAICIPWKKRGVLWNILSLTWCAPFYPVTFRDGFLGDILTSIVRPLQDLAFTILFVPLGLKAWWSSDMYTMDAAAIPLERSWLLHTVVLPACTLSPLWWRFMQNLRQCYDAKQRWPYLGNALKYLLAAEVSTFGLFNPSVKQSPLWMMCFFVTTLYQVWWDVFMDWGLLERESNLGYYYATADRREWFWWWPYTLRSKRLYKRTWMYHVIFVINFCLRFVGMITLIPPVYLSRTTGLIVSAYTDPDFQLFAGLFVALAEIFRRTIWALLRLEWEVIKTAPERTTMEKASRSSSNNNLEADEMKPMDIATSERVWSFSTTRDISVSSLSDMSTLNDIQILSELSVWATVFSGIAIIAAAHREVL